MLAWSDPGFPVLRTFAAISPVCSRQLRKGMRKHNIKMRVPDSLENRIVQEVFWFISFQWTPLPRTRRGDLQVAIGWQPDGSRYKWTGFTETLFKTAKREQKKTLKRQYLGKIGCLKLIILGKIIATYCNPVYCRGESTNSFWRIHKFFCESTNSFAGLYEEDRQCIQCPNQQLLFTYIFFLRCYNGSFRCSLTGPRCPDKNFLPGADPGILGE